MKALLKTTVLALLLVSAIAAQAQQVSFGLKTGIGQANVKVPGLLNDASFLPDFKSITSWNIGAVSEIEFHPNFALQPELNYTVKGFQLQEDFDVNLFNVPLPLGATAISTFNYLEMPLLAKVKFGNESANFYLVAGPTFGYAVSGNLKTRAKVLITEIDLSDTPINLDKVGYERWEVGGTAGAGVSIRLNGGSQLFLDARYSHGFTQPYDIPLVHERVQHNGFNVNVGFLMPFGNGSSPRA